MTYVVLRVAAAFVACGLTTSPLFAQSALNKPAVSEGCREWGQYRDTRLFDDWEMAVKRYKVARERIDDLNDQIRDVESLRDEANWRHWGGNAVYSAKALADFSFQNLGLIAEMTENRPAQIVHEGLDWVQCTIEGAVDGGRLRSAVAAIAEGCARKTAVTAIKETVKHQSVQVIIDKIMGTWQQFENIKRLAEYDQEAQETRERLERQLKRLRNELIEQNELLDNLAEQREKAERLKEYIDRICTQELRQDTEDSYENIISDREQDVERYQAEIAEIRHHEESAAAARQQRIEEAERAWQAQYAAQEAERRRLREAYAQARQRGDGGASFWNTLSSALALSATVATGLQQARPTYSGSDIRCQQARAQVQEYDRVLAQMQNPSYSTTYHQQARQQYQRGRAETLRFVQGNC